jgi:biopolymer transport protein TolR
MGMSESGGTRHAVSEINVTPLIDVLLVLLIIFMVIVPVTPKGLDSQIPQPPRNDRPEPPGTIVVQVLANSQGEPSYLINKTPLLKSQIEPQLAAIFAARQEKVMFVKGDTSLDYSKVAEVIDMGHRANVDSIALITPRIEAGR